MSKRVLIVDDEKNMRWVLGQALSAEGFDVSEAVDGTTGLAAVRSLHPDFVLLDIGLPDIDGLEVARVLSIDGPPPWVVLTSSREAGSYGPRLSGVRTLGFIPKEEVSGPAIRVLVERT